jgi:hypothetical protein
MREDFFRSDRARIFRCVGNTTIPTARRIGALRVCNKEMSVRQPVGVGRKGYSADGTHSFHVARSCDAHDPREFAAKTATI